MKPRIDLDRRRLSVHARSGDDSALPTLEGYRTASFGRAAIREMTSRIAATAAKLLLDSSWRGRGGVAVMGPQDLSYDDLAEIMSGALGKPIRFQQISDDSFKARFVQSGGSEAVAQWLVEMRADSEKNPPGSIERSAENTTPTTFREWCEEVLRHAVQG